ncbi:polyprenyl synthetase family protein [Nonomuraea sp. NPDC049695]|uniref:polyprenyl synthetase family protein n=1 Tax=Nonomuraea sp. NPDC049695 TaxID=3154734 RepID=UPI00343ECDD5
MNGAWLMYEPCLARLARLDAYLDELLTCADAKLSEVARHLLAHGGKRLRPTLLFLAADLDGGTADEEALLRAGAAVELLHVATLYHDDVMDRAETRRGAPTANARWGQAVAVTAGTFIFARAIGLLGGLDARVARWAGEGVLALALGQLQETENAYNPDHQLARYLEVAAKKTAALFELPCRAGAALGGASEEVCEAAGLYGRALGLAFQAVDDVLDLTAEARGLGKRPGTDLREGVYGMPTLVALSHSPHRERLRALLTLDDPADADLAEARDLILGSGAAEHATAIAEDYSRQAVSAALCLPDGPARRTMIQLAAYVVLRAH